MQPQEPRPSTTGCPSSSLLNAISSALMPSAPTPASSDAAESKIFRGIPSFADPDDEEPILSRSPTSGGGQNLDDGPDAIDVRTDPCDESLQELPVDCANHSVSLLNEPAGFTEAVATLLFRATSMAPAAATAATAMAANKDMPALEPPCRWLLPPNHLRRSNAELQLEIMA
mmetsp:Transcript_12490/g.37531  ORF Transcript_12490/g.37531 Transcript_12490/m.37531 type:complete len:172 (-) Transcript_12490:1759-2274(-)